MSDAAEIRMFKSGWFGQGDTFWLWVKTPEAKTYIEEFDRTLQRPQHGEPVNLLGGFDEEEDSDLLYPTHLQQLAADIEARFGRTG